MSDIYFSVETLIIISIALGFIMSFGIGANDVANAIGTAVGSKAISLKTAILIAIIFESIGCFLSGDNVIRTISYGIIDINYIQSAYGAKTIICCMLSVLLTSSSWLLIASIKQWPISTSHTVVASLVSIAAFTAGFKSIYWNKVILILLSWIISPTIGCILGYIIFKSMNILIFNHKNTIERSIKYMPIYSFLQTVTINSIIYIEIPKIFPIKIPVTQKITLFILSTLILNYILTNFIHKYLKTILKNNNQCVESVFSILIILTACITALAHGANDVANAIAPLVTIYNLLQNSITTNTPTWSLALGSSGIIIGLVSLGYKVVDTIAKGITELTPSRGFAASFACALTIVIATLFGYPISTTHTLVGAILGVGIARGFGALNLNVVRGIFYSWFITIPVGAILGIIFFNIFNFII